MNNPILRKIELTADFQPLGGDEVFTVEISTPPTNAANAYMKTGTGSEVPWVPGEYHKFESVKLSEIFVRGTPGDIVTIIGGTW